MSNFKGTEVTLKNRYGTHTVYVPYDDMTITSLLDDLVRPVLLSATYPEALVDAHLPRHDDYPQYLCFVQDEI